MRAVAGTVAAGGGADKVGDGNGRAGKRRNSRVSDHEDEFERRGKEEQRR